MLPMFVNKLGAELESAYTRTYRSEQAVAGLSSTLHCRGSSHACLQSKHHQTDSISLVDTSRKGNKDKLRRCE